MTKNELIELLPDVETLTAEQAQTAIIAFLDFLEERIDNDKIDEFLQKIETRISEDKFGLFRAIFGAVKAKILSKKI